MVIVIMNHHNESMKIMKNRNKFKSFKMYICKEEELERGGSFSYKRKYRTD